MRYSSFDSTHSSDCRGSVSLSRSPRRVAKRGWTRSITPWSVTGVSYATFCCLVSLLPALGIILLRARSQLQFVTLMTGIFPKGEGNPWQSRSISIRSWLSEIFIHHESPRNFHLTRTRRGCKKKSQIWLVCWHSTLAINRQLRKCVCAHYL